MAAMIVTQGGVAVGLSALRGVDVRRRGANDSRRGQRMVVRAEVTEASKVAVNPGISKDNPKVVDTVVVAELSKPLTAYCRCWRSGTFPLCDGTHAKYNKETGDNVGPLLVKK